MPKKLNLIGQKFGRLTVISKVKNLKNKSRVKWLCSCSCGETPTIAACELRNGDTKSCGCLKKEKLYIHGASGTPEHQTWLSMRGRCTDHTFKNYPHYGGRGIKVCERWLNSFPSFLEDIGLRPSKNHSLNRVDNNGNYEPGNCQWATNTEQQRNKNNNHLITINGKTKCLTEWCKEYGLRPGTARARIRDYGWPEVKAITTPARSWKIKERPSLRTRP